jgi:hypothetical protein
LGGSSQIELRPSRLAVLGKLGFLSLFVSLSACWMYRYAVYTVLDGVEAGTLFLFHYLKKKINYFILQHFFYKTSHKLIL